jgi:hypothetical protein
MHKQYRNSKGEAAAKDGESAPVVASEQTSWNRRFGDEPGFSAMPSGPLNQYWKVMSANGMLWLEPTFAILPQNI